MIPGNCNALPAATGQGAKDGEAGNLKADGTRHGAGLHAYEAAKSRLLLLEMTPAAYLAACRQAARQAGV